MTRHGANFILFLVNWQSLITEVSVSYSDKLLLHDHSEKNFPGLTA